MTIFRDQLVHLNACREAVEWVGTRTLAQAWRECQRPDWMLWLAERASIDAHTMTLCACDCAETAVQYAGADEVLACVWAIDAARRGDPKEIEAAAEAAMAGEAARAAWAAAGATARAAGAAAREASLLCADLIRARISVTDIEAGL